MEEKQLHGYLKRQTGEMSKEKIWSWLRKINLTKESKSIQIGAQGNKHHKDQLCWSKNRSEKNKRESVGYVEFNTKRILT